MTAKLRAIEIDILGDGVWYCDPIPDPFLDPGVDFGPGALRTLVARGELYFLQCANGRWSNRGGLSRCLGSDHGSPQTGRDHRTHRR